MLDSGYVCVLTYLVSLPVSVLRQVLVLAVRHTSCMVVGMQALVLTWHRSSSAGLSGDNFLFFVFLFI